MYKPELHRQIEADGFKIHRQIWEEWNFDRKFGNHPKWNWNRSDFSNRERRRWHVLGNDVGVTLSLCTGLSLFFGLYCFNICGLTIWHNIRLSVTVYFYLMGFPLWDLLYSVFILTSWIYCCACLPTWLKILQQNNNMKIVLIIIYKFLQDSKILRPSKQYNLYELFLLKSNTRKTSNKIHKMKSKSYSTIQWIQKGKHMI